MRRIAALFTALGLLVLASPMALASGPGGGGGGTSGVGSGGTGGTSGGGTTVSGSNCSTITQFSVSAAYRSSYPTPDPTVANATIITTQLSGASSCASGGPYTVKISYQNDGNNTIVQRDTSSWTIPGNLTAADGTFAPPGTPYTVFYTVTDGSGHVFLSGSKNITTPPAK